MHNLVILATRMCFWSLRQNVLKGSSWQPKCFPERLFKALSNRVFRRIFGFSHGSARRQFSEPSIAHGQRGLRIAFIIDPYNGTMTALSTARLEQSQFPLQIRSALTEGYSSRSIERLPALIATIMCLAVGEDCGRLRCVLRLRCHERRRSTTWRREG
jgi:hypothetical protein